MSEVILLSHAKQGVRRSLFYSGTAFSLQNKGDGWDAWYTDEPGSLGRLWMRRWDPLEPNP